MSTMTKVFVVLTAVLSIVLSILTVSFAAGSANWRKLAEDYQQLQNAEVAKRMHLEALMATNLALKDDAQKAVSGALEDSQKKNTQLTTDLASARNDLARKTNEATAFEAGRKKLEEIVAVLTSSLTTVEKNYQTILAQNNELQTRNQQLNSRLLDVTSNLTIANDQLRNEKEKTYNLEKQNAELQRRMAEGRRAPSGLESPAGTTPAAAAVAGPIRGEVTNVDGAYASVNVGDSSGVAPGMTFMIHRGDAFVAELVIDTVRPREAGGKIRTAKDSVRPGDAVVYGL